MLTSPPHPSCPSPSIAAQNRALIVGNAQPELQDWLLRQPQTDRIVYTTAPGAAGILEGLGRLGLY